jgi:hypothetical protein
MTRKPIQWLTTAPNPRSPATGYDAGQRGWRVHAVRAYRTQTFDAIKFYPALCGLEPAHGWGVDLYIDRKCARCVAALVKRGIILPADNIAIQTPGVWWKTCAIVEVACPKCANPISLKHEDISDAGKVRLTCLYSGCGHAAIVTLEGWKR